MERVLNVDSALCRLCRQHNETVQHVLIGCTILSGREYICEETQQCIDGAGSAVEQYNKARRHADLALEGRQRKCIWVVDVAYPEEQNVDAKQLQEKLNKD
jgi:hypothetical protein